jgi:hypothetical protein
MIDPFSDEADPARPARLSSGRRPVLLALAVIPAALSVQACAHPAPACPTQPEHTERCRHRFCRYFRG